MTGIDNMFTTLEDPVDHEHVTFGDNSRARIIGLGRITITKVLSISNVMFVESLSFNLLSVAKLCVLGLICTFDKYGVIMFLEKKTNHWCLKGFRYGHFYIIHYSFYDA
jgi:hypothetical protein